MLLLRTLQQDIRIYYILIRSCVIFLIFHILPVFDTKEKTLRASVFYISQNAFNKKEIDSENIREKDGLLTVTSHINQCSISCVVMLFDVPENGTM
jgi:hypothetical protein